MRVARTLGRCCSVACSTSRKSVKMQTLSSSSHFLLRRTLSDESIRDQMDHKQQSDDPKESEMHSSNESTKLIKSSSKRGNNNNQNEKESLKKEKKRFVFGDYPSLPPDSEISTTVNRSMELNDHSAENNEFNVCPLPEHLAKRCRILFDRKSGCRIHLYGWSIPSSYSDCKKGTRSVQEMIDLMHHCDAVSIDICDDRMQKLKLALVTESHMLLGRWVHAGLSFIIFRICERLSIPLLTNDVDMTKLLDRVEMTIEDYRYHHPNSHPKSPEKKQLRKTRLLDELSDNEIIYYLLDPHLQHYWLDTLIYHQRMRLYFKVKQKTKEHIQSKLSLNNNNNHNNNNNNNKQELKMKSKRIRREYRYGNLDLRRQLFEELNEFGYDLEKYLNLDRYNLWIEDWFGLLKLYEWEEYQQQGYLEPNQQMDEYEKVLFGSKKVKPKNAKKQRYHDFSSGTTDILAVVTEEHIHGVCQAWDRFNQSFDSSKKKQTTLM